MQRSLGKQIEVCVFFSLSAVIIQAQKMTNMQSASLKRTQSPRVPSVLQRRYIQKQSINQTNKKY